MAIGFWQKVRLGLAGWSRRRREGEMRRRREFLERATGWGPSSEPPRGGAAGAATGPKFDLEGLQIAWMDGSGRIAYYLDLQSGDVVEVRPGDDATPYADSGRWARVPGRTPESEAEERRLFARTVEPEGLRRRLEATLEAAEPAQAFRRELAGSREAERAWSSFRNERASRAAAAWASSLGTR
ncbi:MAG TPA: hypothetical protein VMS56_16115 [Thermoanaerobaculia bacterium]|nr:hypothetical protein [Thermoanaerobaculia bacterium]